IPDADCLVFTNCNDPVAFWREEHLTDERGVPAGVECQQRALIGGRRLRWRGKRTLQVKVLREDKRVFIRRQRRNRRGLRDEFARGWNRRTADANLRRWRQGRRLLFP